MLVEQKTERKYKSVIPELAVFFERAVNWWYEEACNYRGLPDVVHLLEDHPYLQNIFDVIVESQAIEFGGIKVDEEIPEGMLESISMTLSGEYDKTVSHMLHDIQNYLNSRHLTYVESDFFMLDYTNPNKRRDKEFEVYNSPLVEVW